MLCWERSKWDSTVVSRSLERNKKKQEYAFLAGDEDVKHVLLSCSETRKWRKNF
jgi:hypothetical protein